MWYIVKRKQGKIRLDKMPIKSTPQSYKLSIKINSSKTPLPKAKAKHIMKFPTK